LINNDENELLGISPMDLEVFMAKPRVFGDVLQR